MIGNKALFSMFVNNKKLAKVLTDTRFTSFNENFFTVDTKTYYLITELNKIICRSGTH